VENVAIRLLENSQKDGGAITFIDISTRPSQHEPSHPIGNLNHPQQYTPATSSPSDGCTGSGPSAFICRWRTELSSKIFAMHDNFKKPGCPSFSGRLGPHGRPLNLGGVKIVQPYRGGSHYPHGSPGEYQHRDGGPHHHHHQSPMHRIARAFHHFIMGFVVPVLIGVAAGMTASLLGMVIGAGVAWVWIKVIRSSKRGTCGATMLEEESMAECEEEKKGLLVENLEAGEALPVYVQKE